MLSGNANLAAIGVDGTALGTSFANAALQGGGFVTYNWIGSVTPTEEKISFVVGVRRFGVYYYLGVGFAHVQKPTMWGPGDGGVTTTTCDMNHNYPCAWDNALSLVGHVQSLLLRSSGPLAVPLTEAFMRITLEANYGGQQAVGSAVTSGLLYAFAFEYESGLCVAHGVNSAYVNTLTTTRHQAYMDKADAGGGWVTYEWQNPTDPVPYMKSACASAGLDPPPSGSSHPCAALLACSPRGRWIETALRRRG